MLNLLLDSLGHPNVKLFITQGGLQSVEEAINFKVPVIVVPFFADQFSNAKQVAKKGFGVWIDHHTTTKDELKAAITDVLTNKK